MSQIYYNPKVFTPTKHLEHITVVDPSDRFTSLRLKLRTPYKTREEALKENFWGSIYFYENGVLHSATLMSEWAYKPCTEVQGEGGINWDTYYACSLNDLKEYLEDRGANCEYINKVALYDSELGVYSVQVHYDGRIR